MKPSQNPYACGICRESFSIANALVCHVQSRHEPAKFSGSKKATEFNNNVQESTLVADSTKLALKKSCLGHLANEQFKENVSEPRGKSETKIQIEIQSKEMIFLTIVNNLF